ncbi:hypothetical protein IEQ34_020257 [Dendrobium chrysotoxum]|uniref:F-box domain-containing protein n=1 Tax=Dendrobium chrysotoxum TaxID=161865 RepID=A0AAV7FKG3_DENCH|nr:hypothetical protein IEQ34_020257 [Dendrobium chrysotoxum]
MVYDIAKDDWTMLPEMARERDECTGVFEVNKEGLFRVVSGYCTLMQGRFERIAEAFDVGEWPWLPVEEEVVPERESSKTCVVGGDGRIYAENFSYMEDLIPGLPEEIGLECLIRVPHGTLPLLRQVCSRWKQAIESPLFHHLRRSAGFSHHLIIFVEARQAVRCTLRFFSSHPYCRLVALNLSTGEWAPLPSIPLVFVSHPFFFWVVASGLHLVVIGGLDRYSVSCNDSVYVYSFLSNTWRHGRPMPGPTRFLFACAGTTGNQVIIAGGDDERKNALKSVMVYDIARDDWTTLPEMPREHEDCTRFFSAGLFQVIGGSKQKTLQWSREEDWLWQAMEEEFSKTCMMGGYGRIYKRGVGGKMLLVKEGEEWREVAELPEDVRGSPIMVAWVEILMVARVESCCWPSTVFLLEMKKGVATGWRRVAFPKKYHGYFYTACVDI